MADAFNNKSNHNLPSFYFLSLLSIPGLPLFIVVYSIINGFNIIFERYPCRKTICSNHRAHINSQPVFWSLPSGGSSGNNLVMSMMIMQASRTEVRPIPTTPLPKLLTLPTMAISSWLLMETTTKT